MVNKSKKRKLSEQIQTLDQSDEDAGIFTVEVILKARVASLKKKSWEYYVKWAGYDSEENTWEPEDNLEQCKRLLDSFWRHIGWDWNDYHEGHECVPDPKWIAAEKKRFWQGCSPHDRQRYERAEEMRRRGRSPKISNFDAQLGNLKNQIEKQRDLGYLPFQRSPSPVHLWESSSSRAQGKNLKKRARTKNTDIETDSDTSDIPLREKAKVKKAKKKRRVASPVSSDDEPIAKQIEKLKPKSKSQSKSKSTSFIPDNPQDKIRIAIPKAINNKGKQREEASDSPDSPSSLFSVDMSPSPETENNHLPPTSSAKIPPASKRKPRATLPLSAQPAISKYKSSPAIPPKAFNRPLNPHARLLSDPSLTSPIDGISTKQRLGQMALAPINPKNARNKLPSFKKTQAPANASSPNEPSHPNVDLVPDGSTTPSNTIPPPDMTLHALNTVNQNEDWPSMSIDMQPTSMSPVAMAHASDTAVDDFLTSVSTSLPLHIPESPTDPIYPSRKPMIIPGKIPKKWKWEGKLYLIRPNDEEECVGNMLCTNTSKPKEGGSRIPQTFDTMERLEFLSFHDLSDLDRFLDACKSSDQFATLTAQDEDTTSSLKTLVDYMSKHEKIALIPIWYQENLFGHLLIFPHSPSFRSLVRQLEVPSDVTAFAANGGLLVSLHNWVLSPTSYREESRRTLSSIIPAEPAFSIPPKKREEAQSGQSGLRTEWSTSLSRSPIMHLAINVLKFPPDLFEWFLASFRPYAIYHEFERVYLRSEHVEDEMLKAILEGCQAREWKHKSATNPNDQKKESSRLRVIFIHVGSIRKFRYSPLTAKRRSLEMRYYTYGTDPNFPRYMWGIREVYPIGGVVTFLPSAFTEDYVMTINLIRKIHEHPLWMGFISPACLGYLASTISGDNDTLAFFEGKLNLFTYTSLLKCITEGEIAFLTAPPDAYTSADKIKSWVRDHCRTLDERSALSMGVSAFNSVCANQSDCLKAVHEDVLENISTIQWHPAILYEYRRFVTVKDASDTAIKAHNVEYVTAQAFEFQDNFFPEE